MVWNNVTGAIKSTKPTPPTNNSSVTESGAKDKSKMSSVAYVLVGAGVAFMLLALYMSFYNRRKRRRRSVESTEDLNHGPSTARSQEESPEVINRRHEVPTYEEVMGNDHPEGDGQGIERDGRMSMSLPSYESLVDVGVGEEPSSAAGQPAPSNPEEQPMRQNSKAGRMFKSLKVRRIKSDKLHLKDFRIKMTEKTDQSRVVIEPLTPPPQYDDVAKNPFEDVQRA